MASCFALPNFEVEITDTGATRLTLTVIFSGVDVPNGKDLSTAVVDIASADAPTTIRQKLTDALIAEAQRIGYSLAPTAIILPAFQKGA